MRMKIESWSNFKTVKIQNSDQTLGTKGVNWYNKAMERNRRCCIPLSNYDADMPER